VKEPSRVKRKITTVAVIWLVGSLVMGVYGEQLERNAHQWFTSADEMELERIEELYAAQQYSTVADRCERLVAEPGMSQCRPRALYLNWLAARKLGDEERSGRIMSAFLQQYPTNELGAQMHLAAATRFISQDDLPAAERELSLIEQRYRNTPAFLRARQMRDDLAKLTE